MDTLTDPQLGTISFVRRARARRIVVRILPDGLRVTLPPLVPAAEGLRFVREHEGEIARKQDRVRSSRQAGLLLPGDAPALHTRTFDVRVAVENGIDELLCAI